MIRSKLASLGCVVALVLACSSLMGCADNPAPLAPRAAACPPASSLLSAQNPWVSGIVSRVQSKAFYPAEALRAAQEGTSTLCVDVARSGLVLNAFVSMTSGSALLDGAALFALGRARTGRDKFVGIPDDLAPNSDHLWIAIPVVYRVDGPPELPSADPACDGTPSAPFYRAINDGLQKKLYYPGGAQGRSVEGDAKIRFTVHDDDRWTDTVLVSSSGESLIDGVSLMTVGAYELSAERPCFPKMTPGHPKAVVVEVPLHFRLTN